MHTMKRLITALILVFSLCLCMASFALADAVGTISDDCVRIRTNPSPDSEIYQQLNKGDTVTVIKDANKDGWVEIRFTYEADGTTRTGYVSKDYISIDGAADSKKESKTETKKEETKKDEPKKEESKKDESKKETPKKDESKKDEPKKDTDEGDSSAKPAAEAEETKKPEKEEPKSESNSAAADSEISESVSLTATATTAAKIRKSPKKDANVVLTVEQDCILTVIGDEDDNGWIKVSYAAGDGEDYKGYVKSELLDINAIGKGSCVIASTIIRESAEAGAAMVGVLPLKSDVDIFASRDGMYRIEYKDLSGWVSTDSIQVESKEDCYGYGIVNRDKLRLRAKRSTESSIKAKMPEGVVLQLLDSKDGWYKTNYNGLTGYVMADYITETEPTFKGYVQVTASSLYLRSGAGTDFAKLAIIPSGKVLKTTGAVGAWYEVTYHGFTGFISGDFVSATTKDGFKTDASGLNTNAIIVTGDALNVRSKPDQESEKITSLPYGTVLDVLEKNGEWYQIDYDGEVAYVKAEFTSTVGEAAAKAAAAAERSSESSSSESSAGSQSSSSNGSALSYASQFVGNRYVWGGTSLTNGADCSGFVKAVFAKYGVYLPHSSSAIRGYGKSVSYSDMRPGDVVCYSGHVGIYAGNGQLLSALNKKKGITYCSVNYKKILSIRRMM